jgi:hypothetical protein
VVLGTELPEGGEEVPRPGRDALRRSKTNPAAEIVARGIMPAPSVVRSKKLTASYLIIQAGSRAGIVQGRRLELPS